MSHFTVLVKVTQEKLAEHDGDVELAVRDMLAPYQENNMGTCPGEFLAFNDMTQELEERAKKVITADREYGRMNPHVVGKTFLEVMGFDDYADYCGYKKNEETGKYGYWENPNAKWDWYQIGGRWSGLLRVNEMADTAQRGEHTLLDDNPIDEPHTADIASVSDIDFEGMNLEVDIKIEEFWDKYNKFHTGELKEDHWVEYDIRSTLIDVGFIKIVDEGERNENGDWVRKPQFEELPFTLEDLKSKGRWHWEFGTWAVLDENGWHEKGKMGWFGMSSATHEDEKEWSKSYVDTFLKNEKQDTLLAIIDAHI
jgi:hypothetical protein